MSKIYPARNLATFPVRAKGNNIEVPILLRCVLPMYT